MCNVASHLQTLFELGSEYEDYKKMATIQVNSGTIFHYGDAIDEVDAGNVNIKVTIPTTYGNASISCTHQTSSGETSPCGQSVGTSSSFTVSSTKEKDSIDIEIQLRKVNCASPFTFTINVKGKTFIYLISSYLN